MQRKPMVAAAMAGAALGLSACVSWGWFEPADFLKLYELPLQPTKNEVVLCHGYGCQVKTPVDLTSHGWPHVRAQFASVTTPAEEREAIARAVGIIETEVGPVLGTSNDEGGVLNASWSGDPAHQDCVDEAANTTSLLLAMDNDGLLRFHTVDPPVIRGAFIDGRYQHYTAVVRETGSGNRFAIDSWFRDNGKPAVIMTYTDWITGYGVPE